MKNQQKVDPFPILSEYFSQATKNFSQVTRTLAFTIIAATLTFFYKAEQCLSQSWIVVAIITISVLCILLDGIQYFYIAFKIKPLLKQYANTNNESDTCDKKDKNEKMYEKNSNVKDNVEKIHNNAFTIIIAKFCMLFLSTLLLLTLIILWIFK